MHEEIPLFYKFDQPYDEVVNPEYLQIIKNPMYIANVFRKATNEEYTSFIEFVLDIEMIANQRILYAKLGKDFVDVFEKLVPTACKLRQCVVLANLLLNDKQELTLQKELPFPDVSSDQIDLPECNILQKIKKSYYFIVYVFLTINFIIFINII